MVGNRQKLENNECIWFTLKSVDPKDQKTRSKSDLLNVLQEIGWQLNENYIREIIVEFNLQ